MSGDAKKVADTLISELKIDKNDAYEIYNNVLKAQLNTTNWAYNYYGNDSLSSTKVSNAVNRILHFNLATDNRYVNISLTKFDKEKQVLIQVLETLPRSSSMVLDKYNELKNDSSFKVSQETEFFAVFNKNEKTNKVKTMVNSGVGAIQYVDFYYYNL